MTTKQTQLYFREWANVRKIKPDADRHALHMQALGEDKSSKAFSNAEFDKVLGVFRAISQPDSVNAQLRQLRQNKHRLVWKITVEQATLLSVLVTGEDEIERRTAAERMIIAVMKDKFHTEDINSLSAEERPRRGRNGRWMEDSQLEMLRNTVARMISEKRQADPRDLDAATLYQLAGLTEPGDANFANPVIQHEVAA